MQVPVYFARSFRVLVIFPLTIAGPAIMCAAALLMCFSSLTVLSTILRGRDPQYVQARLLGTQLLLRGEQRYDTTADTTASLDSVPNVLRDNIQSIRFDVPPLAPMAFAQFCSKYANECKPRRLLFRGGRLRMTSRRWTELENVNRSVNSSILPVRNEESLAGEKWMLGPVFGRCHDYAVTKRHQLIAMGWPARAVLLSEVVTVSGEHHLVTVVRANGGDLVLDNLTSRIMPWSQTAYLWVRIQTPRNPTYWASISGQNAGPTFSSAQIPQRFAASL